MLHSLQSQGAVVEQVPMDAIGKIKSVLAVLDELRMEPGSGVGVRHPVITGRPQDVLPVPTDVTKALAGCAPADGIPVFVPAPILVTDVEVQQGVIDVLRDIKVLFHQVVLRRITEAANPDHGIVGGHVATHDRPFIDHVIIFLRATQVLRGKTFVGSLRRIVDAPIEPVQIQMHIPVVGRKRAHVPQAILDECVPGPLPARPLHVAPMQPREIEIRPQVHRVKGRDGQAGEKRILEFARSVIALERQPECMLRRLHRIAHGIPLALDAAIDLESRGVRQDQLRRTWPLPRRPAVLGLGIDARGVVEHVLRPGHNGQHGQRPQRIVHQIAIRRRLRNLRVHFIIRRPVPAGRVDPDIGHARRRVGLLDHLLRKNVGVRRDRRRQVPRPERCRPQNGGRPNDQ